LPSFKLEHRSSTYKVRPKITLPAQPIIPPSVIKPDLIDKILSSQSPVRTILNVGIVPISRSDRPETLEFTTSGRLLAMEGDTMLAKVFDRLCGQKQARKAWMASAALAALSISTGCQVEYAGMTLPSGKYFHDDVQHFDPGPKFPYANTMAATQRARMKALGIDVPAPTGGRVITPPVPAGNIDPERNAPGNLDDTENPMPVSGGRDNIPAVPPPGGRPGQQGNASVPN
jgi:hypothetical protein